MQNVKEKMRNVKGGAVVHLGTSVVWKSGNISSEFTTNIPSEGSGISRWAVATLAGMQWPHRILFELDPRNQGKDGLSDNQKHKITAAT